MLAGMCGWTGRLAVWMDRQVVPRVSMLAGMCGWTGRWS